MSHNFRDLEQPDAARRKDAVLMAAISGLECLEHPTRQDMARFSRLFIPLFAAASQDVRRTASAALSRLSRLPDDVAEMLVNEPIAIAAPFIAHYPLLKESTLARAVARHGAPHARAAARRSDLSPQAIAALRSLDDPSVEGLLILRGLIPDPAKAPSPSPAPAAAPVAAAQAKTRPLVEAPPLDPSEKLRAELKALALRSRTAGTGTPAAKPRSEVARSKYTPPKVGHRAPAQPLNRPVSARKLATGPATRPDQTVASGPLRHRVTPVRLDQLARYAQRDQENWFATALADAMETSFALAERIMMDVSGRQLATALIGLGVPETTIKSALESFFPHLAQPSAKHTLATDLIGELDSVACTARLEAWQRADNYTSGGSAHVPALADTRPVRHDPVQRAAPQDTRKTSTPRKTG